MDICDGNMEEGSLRCDANVSIRRAGETALGVKVEIKNLNSLRNVKRAIEFEVSRMQEMADKNETIVQQTRSFDASNGTTFAMRSKEEANDYRYFPDPDIPPFEISAGWLQEIKQTIPALPEQLIIKYTGEFQLSRYDAEVLTDDRDTALYFEALIALTPYYKAAANWVLGPVKSYLNEKGLPISSFGMKPGVLASLIALVEDGRVHFSTASSKIFPELASGLSEDPLALATSLNLIQTDDESQIMEWVNQAMDQMPDKVLEYRKGKKGLLGLFVGEVKKISKGKADPQLTNKLLIQKLEK
jgi:aspartyl-tRNA(Asn)/glutamyl-tRNA(Gln) amidotransferase subunit B